MAHFDSDSSSSEDLDIDDISVSDLAMSANSDTTDFGSIAVSVVKADICNLQVKVDVVVNTCPGSLDLTSSATSKALLTRGGPTIAQELLGKGPITEGAIVVTSGGNLTCKKIYHTTLKSRRHNHAQGVKTLMNACLTQAESSRYTSIAFPALGTGNLKYPKQVVASAMFGAIEAYNNKHTGTCIRSVFFVIFPTNTDVYSAFTCASKKEDTSPREAKSGTVLGVTIKVNVGSLVEQTADAIMTTTTRALDLNNGNLCKSVLAEGGPGLQTECKAKYPNGLKHGDIAVISAGKLNTCKYVYCGAIPRFDRNEPGIGNPEDLYKQVITSCLQQAAKDGLTSICFPALGTGRLKYPPFHAARYTLTAISAFLSDNPNTSIQTVIIAVHNTSDVVRSTLGAYESELKRLTGRTPSVQSMASMGEAPDRMTPEFCAYMYKANILPPPYWTKFRDDQSIKEWASEQEQTLELVDVDEDEFEAIATIVNQSWRADKHTLGRDAEGLAVLGYTGLDITEIKRVENLTLYEQYANKRQQIFCESGKAGLYPVLEKVPGIKNGQSTIKSLLNGEWADRLYAEVNEEYFLHGTKPENVESVYTQGLDPRLANKAVLGAAVYMAESSTKADQYADARNSRQTTGLTLFLVRACLGNICRVTKCRQMRRPPCTDSTCSVDECTHVERYDSVVEEEQYIFREFVVYDRTQVYPEYVITYDRV
ncbi:hypothetical protein DPMN_108413 [Dreissena polymorpha]|uniref:Poly [ADP-ribose] polymerase n=2 Tax=Dreissena polymorpha TaxID=45954 RepID=A0A9D4K8T0_DREPO|nr:hypothetical protein DPMN_108413 [Dreissena polymorpha]